MYCIVLGIGCCIVLKLLGVALALPLYSTGGVIVRYNLFFGEGVVLHM